VLGGSVSAIHADVVATLVAHANAHPTGEVAWSFDQGAWTETDHSIMPIGMFDSGIGGLTVLEAILALDVVDNDTLQPGADGRPDFVNERFIYFGDQANMPYGNYPAAGHADFLRERILKDAIFLLGRRYHPAALAPAPARDKPPVKAIVIACNTATAYGLEDIRAAVAAWDIPVFVLGVVEAGARGLLEIEAEATADSMAVLATVATCASGIYTRTISHTLEQAGRTVPVIFEQGSAQLAAAIEGDPAVAGQVDDIIRHDLRALLGQLRAQPDAAPIRSVMLGCTHFPLVLPRIEAAFAELQADPAFAGLVAAPRVYVDPAEWTARELWRELAARGLLRRAVAAAPTATWSTDQLFIAVANAAWPDVEIEPGGGFSYAYKYGRTAGQPGNEDTLVIPLTAATLPAGGADLVRTQLPLVWRRIAGGLR
jgi:glutamate racemase